MCHASHCFPLCPGQLVKLPRTPNISKVLEDYRAYATTKKGKTEHISGEIVAGLKASGPDDGEDNADSFVGIF